MSSYFSYFPSLLYANTAAVNIIAKVQFDASVLKRSVSFYPYTIINGQRADSIAEQYYGDPSYDWLIYLSNNIIDPINEWPKSENEFNDFLTLKYGSVANTQQQTAYYQVSYSFDERVIGVSTYNALAAGQKKYWMPIINSNDVVINYQRKPIDTVVETNQVVQLIGTFGSIPTSTVIKQSSSVIGTVSFANSSTIVLKHITGTWATATPVYFVATGSVANATITASSIVHQTIPLDEIAYWSAVSIYESEANLNESRKHIRLLNSAYVDVVERDMKDLL